MVLRGIKIIQSKHLTFKLGMIKNCDLRDKLHRFQYLCGKMTQNINKVRKETLLKLCQVLNHLISK